MTKLTPRQTEILASMTPDTWYKPSDLGTSQKFMNDLAALKKVRRRTPKKQRPIGYTLARLESAEYCLRGEA